MAQAGGNKPKAKVPLSERILELRLSFSLIITILILLLILCVGMFIFGVMVGRGQNPQNHLPQIAQHLTGDTPESTQQPVEGPSGALSATNVIPPEQLSYSHKLKNKQAQPPKEGQNVAPPLTGTATLTPAPTQQPPAPAAAAVQPQPQAQGKMYDYIFQVATLKQEEAVDRLRVRLEEKGLRTRMVKDDKLLKVMVLLRGTEAAADQLRQLMVDMKLGQPLQRSKTVVKP